MCGVWDTRGAPKARLVLRGHESTVHGCCYWPGGREILTVRSPMPRVRPEFSTENRRIRTLDPKIQTSESGTIIQVSNDRTMVAWDSNEGEELMKIGPDHTSKLCCSTSEALGVVCAPPPC